MEEVVKRLPDGLHQQRDSWMHPRRKQDAKEVKEVDEERGRFHRAVFIDLFFEPLKRIDEQQHLCIVRHFVIVGRGTPWNVTQPD